MSRHRVSAKLLLSVLALTILLPTYAHAQAKPSVPIASQTDSQHTAAIASEKRRLEKQKLYPGSVYGASLVSQSHKKTPTGAYLVGQQKIRYHKTYYKLSPEKGLVVPSLAAIRSKADTYSSSLHLAGNFYFYQYLYPENICILKFHNVDKNQFGWVAIYRAKDGKWFMRSNTQKTPWTRIYPGGRVTRYWQFVRGDQGDRVYIYLELPTLNNGKSATKGDKINYKFYGTTGKKL